MFRKFWGLCAALSAFPLAGWMIIAGSQAWSHGGEQLETGRALIETRLLYLDACASCHGKRGRGAAPGTPSFSDPQALTRLDEERIARELAGEHAGRLQRALDESERYRIARFVRDYLMLPAPGADVATGRAIYARSCSVCHGDKGDASSWARNSLNPPPADFTAHSTAQLSRDEMIDSVTFGSDGTAMMAFATQLDRDEITATVDYIREAFMSDTVADGANGHGGQGHGRHDHGGHGHGDGEGYPGDLAGDPVSGRAFYEDNCAECHGKNGDGQGPRAYFMVHKPAEFLSNGARGKLSRAHLYAAISEGVLGTTMPAWQTVLSPQQIADVSEHVYQNFLHREDADQSVPLPVWRPNPVPAPAKKKN